MFEMVVWQHIAQNLCGKLIFFLSDICRKEKTKELTTHWLTISALQRFLCMGGGGGGLLPGRNRIKVFVEEGQLAPRKNRIDHANLK